MKQSENTKEKLFEMMGKLNPDSNKSKINEDQEIGINFRSLLDGELGLAVGNVDFNDNKQRNEFITKLNDRLVDNDWISFDNGLTFRKSFTP